MLLKPGKSKAEIIAEEANDPVIASAGGKLNFVVAAWEAKTGKEGILQCQIIKPNDTK
jgi:hypothetical protein